jgi:hypothetical protein
MFYGNAINHWTSKVLVELHEGPVKGHSSINTTIKKILTLCYWWLTLNKDVVEMSWTCDIYQHLGPLWRNGNGPFKPILAFELFMKWGFDFMGPIKLV